MNESGLHILRNAEVLLRGSQIEQSMDALGKIDIDSLSPHDKASYYLIWVEAKLSLGEYEIGIGLEHILNYYGASDDIEKLARAKFLSGWHSISIGKFFEAKEPLLESLVAFKKTGNWAWQGRVLSKLGLISFTIGEFESAVGFLQRSTEIYHQNHDTRNVFLNSLNLAQLNTSLGRLSDAIEIFERTKKDISIVSYKNACAFFLQCAVPYALKGDFSSAWSNLEKALDYMNDLMRERAAYFGIRGWFHILEGSYDNALSALRQGVDIALKIAPESVLSTQIKRLMADAYLALGDHAAARQFADKALAVADKLHERVEIAGCHRIHGQLDAITGDTDSAREWFGKAMNMYSMIGTRYELAFTRYLAATSGVHFGGERQALLYLAREYFTSENVAHLAEKTERELTRPPRPSARPGRPADQVPTIICRSASMKRLVALAEHIAPSGMSVLLTGPTGTGKDLLARYIHHFSGRPGRFISVNAAAIPNDMIESELFGYRRGAYTGAAMTTSGWIEESEGGTFYLNEIADSSPELQAKLLDVIENRRICRLGERQEREVDCRFIAATNHSLEKLIEDGLFRLDLYHRLNEIPIQLPPLSERREDIELLMEHFFKIAGVKITTDADRAAFAQLVRIFHLRPWQGNVRQLETETKRLALVSRGDMSRMVDMAGAYHMSTKEETLAALQRAGWNRREVGRILGISESTVRHRIKIYNLSEDM